jgi:hypothetical protein
MQTMRASTARTQVGLRILCLAIAVCSPAVITTSGCTDCGQSECLDSITVKISLAGTHDQLVGASAMLCRNDICAAGNLVAVSGKTNEAGGELTCSTFTVDALAVDQDDGTAAISFDYFSNEATGGDAAFVDGDTYHVSIAGMAGVVLFDKMAQAAYTTRSCQSHSCHTLLLNL